MMTRKSILKRIVLLVVILFISFVVIFKWNNIISLAKMYTAEEALRQSQSRPVTVKSWVATMKNPEHYTLRNSCSDSRGGRTGTITYEELKSDKHLFCSAKGVHMCNGSDTYTKEGTYTATPAEAWVLAEADNNLPGKKEGYIIYPTRDKYYGDPNQLKDFAKSEDNIQIYEVSGTTAVGDERYVIEEADGYYYVQIAAGAGGGDGTYSYVQYAWWHICTRDDNAYTPEDLSGGLVSEAKDFEKYVKEMNGGDTSWPKNDDGTFKINYDVGYDIWYPNENGKLQKTDDFEKLQVGFDSTKNKYVIGPISVNYKRRVGKDNGNRPKVNFSGISKVLLVGVDADGNELLDSEGESVLVQNSNYRIVMANQEKHNKKLAEYEDTESTYPFPYSDEKFYLEVDYIDGMVGLKSLKIDFYYMTARGAYEVMTGTHQDPPDANGNPGGTEPSQKLSSPVGANEQITVDASQSTDTHHEGGGVAGANPVELDLFADDDGDGGGVPLYTSMGGMVWIDNDPQKESGSGTIGLYDGKDKPAPKNSVEVVVWKVKYEVSGSSYKEIEREKAIAWKQLKKDGKLADTKENRIDFSNSRIYIDGDGKWTIPVIQVPSEEGMDTSKYRMAYDVEFVYDGQTYEATEFLVPSSGAGASGTTKSDVVKSKLAGFYKTEQQTKGKEKDYTEYAKSSYVIENPNERKDFDSYFTEVYGGNAIDTKNVQNGDIDYNKVATKGYGTGGKGSGSQYAKEEYGEGAGSTTQVPASLEYNAKVEGENGAEKTISNIITHDKDGFIYDQYKFAARVSEGGLKFPYEEKYHFSEKENVIYDNITVQQNTYKPIYEYFHQINLGLLEREVADVSVIKDLYTANVVVNEHLSTYHYNKLGQITDDALTLQETLGYRKQKYNVDLYSSDYYYRSSAYTTIEDEITKELVSAVKDGTELQLFLTYRIQFTNESPFTNVSINEFKDYYDSSFTLITNEMCKNKSEDKSDSEGNGNDGKFEKYISSIKAAGSDKNEEVSRELRTVAYAPYYRKLTTKPNPEATSTNTDTDIHYYWNRDDDLKANIVEKGVIGKNIDVELGKDENGYKTFTSKKLMPESSINSGRLPSEDGLVIEPNETIEFYVSFQVDVEGFKKAAAGGQSVEAKIANGDTGDASTETANADAKADESKVKDGKVLEAAPGTVREKLTGAKSNIVEITRYSTGYNYNQNGSTARHKTVSYTNGNISGRIDQDSAPNNIDITQVKMIEGEDGKEIDGFRYTEDDTEFAPTVQVSVKIKNNIRKLNGIVWEDSRKENDVPDGVYDGEAGIPDVDVTMVEKIRVTRQDLVNKGYTVGEDLESLSIIDNEFEYVWKEDQIPGFEAKKLSGADGTYEFTNYPTGTFVVRFEYGNDLNDTDLKYNGQDYKNTTYQVGMKNPSANADNVPRDAMSDSSDMTYLAGKSTLNNEWHDLSDGVSNKNGKLNDVRVSDARDYEPQRLRTIAYSRTLTNENAEVLASSIATSKDIKTLDIAELSEDERNVKNHMNSEYKNILTSDDGKDELSDRNILTSDDGQTKNSKKQEFIDNTRMVANTAKLFIDVEKQSETTYKTINGVTTATTQGDSVNTGAGIAVTTHEYNVNNIDFGLTERPETRINVQKEIRKMQLTKNDGQDIILSVECDEDGNITKEPTGSGSNSIRVEKVTEINKKDLGAGQGFKYIAMESGFLKGLQIKITYKIDIYNRSEVDYIGTTLSNIKNSQMIYYLADNFENSDTERLYSSEENINMVPFISGKGIIYGRYVGSYYYTNEYIEKAEDINAKYSTNGMDRYDKLAVVTTTVDQLVDYIDNDLSISLEDTANIENQSWANSSDSDRKNKLSDVAYVKGENGYNTEDETMLQDNKKRTYVVKNGTDEDKNVTKNNIALSVNTTMTEEPTTITYTKIAMAKDSTTQPSTTSDKIITTGTLNPTESEKTGEIVNDNAKSLKFITYNTNPVELKYMYTINKGLTGNQTDVYNGRLTKELIPEKLDESENKNKSTATINIVTTAQANEEAINNMNYDNLVEIAMYSNTAGRRDMQAIPGNANMIAKDHKAFEAGYNRYYNDNGDKIWKAKEVSYGENEKIFTERDAYAARDTVTFSEPTGLSIERITVNRVVNIILAVLIIAAVTMTVVIIVIVVKKKKKYDDKDILNINK